MRSAHHLNLLACVAIGPVPQVVYEIKPMTGGGIEMELTVPLDATSCETEQGLRNGIATYFTGEEVVVLVSKSALRASHYLDTSCEADGYKELLRFAANFVCKADGSSVTADIIYLNDAWTPYAPDPSARDSATYNGETVLALSRDPSNPTLFNTGTGVDYLSASGVCQNPGQERPHGSRFRIVASAAAAPESCGSFYWDPLLQAVEGDGYGFTGPTRGKLVLSGESGDLDDDPCFPGSALVTTSDGRSVRLDALVDDDEIMAVDSNGAVTPDKVSMLLSVAKPEAKATFVSLTTKSGGELNLTAEVHVDDDQATELPRVPSALCIRVHTFQTLHTSPARPVHAIPCTLSDPSTQLENEASSLDERPSSPSAHATSDADPAPATRSTTCRSARFAAPPSRRPLTSSSARRCGWSAVRRSSRRRLSLSLPG